MINIDQLPIDTICQYYQLGLPIKFHPVTGGLLHQVFYLKTSRGEFALKCLDKQLDILTTDFLSPDYAQTIALYLQERNIPTTIALKQNNCYVFSLPPHNFMLFPWVSGQMLASEQVNTQQARIVGNILAEIHSIPVSGDFQLPNWVGLSKHQWQTLLQPLHTYDFDIMNLTKWSEHASTAQEFLNRQVVFSHRDFDPKNVIWSTPTSPVLLDWEFAGYIHPTLDLLIVALNWSNILTGNINQAKFLSVIEGYKTQKTHELAPLSKEIWGGYFGYCLDWLIYNLKKPLDQQIACNIAESLRVLQAVENCREEITAWYSNGILKC